MKIGIYGGEAFPVYSVYTNGGFTEIEVDVATFEKWKKVFEDFSQVQEEIVQEMEKQDKGDQVWSHGTWKGISA